MAHMTLSAKVRQFSGLLDAVEPVALLPILSGEVQTLLPIASW